MVRRVLLEEFSFVEAGVEFDVVVVSGECAFGSCYFVFGRLHNKINNEN